MFRSEPMALCQMFIQSEAAYSSVAELGESGCVQFRDLNARVSAFQRKFVSEVRRCNELERKIRYIEEELRKDDIKMPEVQDEPRPPYPREIIDLEAKLEAIELEIRELANNNVNLLLNYRALNELKLVLQNAGDFFVDTEIMSINAQRFSDASAEYVPPSTGQKQREELGFVAGIINLDRFFAFERMLWRISRGNVFLKRSDLTEPLPDGDIGDKKVHKTIFVAFFQGDQLKKRVKKVCAGFHASLYPCPSSFADRQEMVNDIGVRMADINLVLNQGDDHRHRVLIAASKNLPTWDVMVTKMKAIYHTLNLFNMDLSNNCLVGEAWVPMLDLPVVREALARGSAKVNSTMAALLNVIETCELPPTYYRTNKFTRGFQNLIDAYGLSTYGEANPALYTCITFPFLFAVMFGDIGHGLIVLLVASYMVWNEQKFSKISGEIFNIFFGGRYILFLMGFFAIYTGFIYNDIFSKSMNLFGSAWRTSYTPAPKNSTNSRPAAIKGGELLMLNPLNNLTGVYPFGMDPVWALADNNLIFLNNYKMKLSIILGLAHMIFGVIMSLVNFLHFKKYSHIFLEFVPQLLFLILLFGYLVFMMFFKWVTYSGRSTTQELSPGCAPSILILFINMLLFGHTEPRDGCKEFMFEGQQVLQTILVVLALLCIPWMLLGNPLLEAHRRKKRRQEVIANGTVNGAHSLTVADTAPTPAKAAHGDHNDEEEPLSEVFIKQIIHTIEYVLSTISHTASYLRLWALSLAHAQLSDVLWKMMLQKALILPIPVPFGAFIIAGFFAPWTLFTITILVVMEGLSAFLHTLRLHWVEFMSKFYDGVGYAFQPFSFKEVLSNTNEE